MLSPNIQIRKLPLPPHTMKLFQLEWQQNYAASSNSSGSNSNYFQLPALLMHMHRVRMHKRGQEEEQELGGSSRQAVEGVAGVPQ